MCQQTNCQQAKIRFLYDHLHGNVLSPRWMMRKSCWQEDVGEIGDERKCDPDKDCSEGLNLGNNTVLK